MDRTTEFLDELIAALRTGAPECIGYGDATQAAFRHGWNAAMQHVWTRLAPEQRAYARRDSDEEVAA